VTLGFSFEETSNSAQTISEDALDSTERLRLYPTRDGIYFSARAGIGFDPYVYDGNSVRRVVDLEHTDIQTSFVRYKGLTYFVSPHPDGIGSRIWVSDETEAGTEIYSNELVDIESMTAVNGRIFVVSENVQSGNYELSYTVSEDL
jgi:hypothetical protein